MKKLVLSVMAVAAFGFAANAQEKEKPSFGFQENDFYVEGNFTINSNKNDSGDKETKFNFNPKVGYLLSDKFAVGASFAVGHEKDYSDAKSDNFYGGVYGRYYFLELGNRFKTYAELGVGFNQIKNAEMKDRGLATDLSVGFNYFLTENIAIAFNMGQIVSFNTMKQKVGDESGKTRTDFNAQLNIFDNFFNQAQFGLIYKF